MSRNTVSTALSQLVQFWAGLSRPEKATWIAVALGFIVDSSSILQIILTNRTSTTQFDYWVPSTGTAFVIWAITSFMYLAFLQAYWEQNKDELGFHNDFRSFLLGDLFYNFRKPMLLFPVIVLIALLFGIIAIFDTSGFLQVGLGLCIAVLLLVVIYSKFTVGSIIYRDPSDRYFRKPSKTFKQQVEFNWSSWEQRIDVELSRYMWVTPGSFTDITTTRGLSHDELVFILAYYASKHPEHTRFGTIWQRGDQSSSNSRIVTVDALINLRHFDHTMYYIS